MVVLLAWSAAVAALDISLCASFNTASMAKSRIFLPHAVVVEASFADNIFI